NDGFFSIIIQPDYALVRISVVNDEQPMAFRLARATKCCGSLWQKIRSQVNRFNAIQVYISEPTGLNTQLYANVGAIKVALRIKGALFPTFTLWTFFSQWDRNNLPTTGGILCGYIAAGAVRGGRPSDDDQCQTRTVWCLLSGKNRLPRVLVRDILSGVRHWHLLLRWSDVPQGRSCGCPQRLSSAHVTVLPV